MQFTNPPSQDGSLGSHGEKSHGHQEISLGANFTTGRRHFNLSQHFRAKITFMLGVGRFTYLAGARVLNLT